MAAIAQEIANRFRWVQGGKARHDRPTEEQLSVASQWRLMWLKFRRHRLAMVGAGVVLLLYLMVPLSGFLAPYDASARTQYPYAPPNRIHFLDDGRLHPFVYALKAENVPGSLARTYVPDPTRKIPVRFFARGRDYRLLGLIPASVHLLQADQGGDIFLFGTDKLGRDIFSRAVNGATISLSIGLVGVFVSFVLGAVIGGFSGYYGGVFDTITQRLIEFLLSIPTIPLWMGLSAAIPASWPALRVYFAITIILSLQGWCGMARVVRGKLLQLREEDFVLDAQLAGASDWRIVVRHMLPAFMSYLIVHLTLAVPAMILGETALSFLGLGLRPPIVSWGVLIQDAQNVRTVLNYPWQLAPGAFVIVTVLAFNFFGDGLRDAADPYKS